jgi:hypothetical protein
MVTKQENTQIRSFGFLSSFYLFPIITETGRMSGFIVLKNLNIAGQPVPRKMHKHNYAPIIIGIVICVLLVAGVIFLGVYYGSPRQNSLPYINRSGGVRDVDGYDRVKPRKIPKEEWEAVVIVGEAEAPINPVPVPNIPSTGSSTGSDNVKAPKPVVSQLAQKPADATTHNDTVFLHEATGPQTAALVATGADVVVVLHSKRCPACINLLKTLNAGKDQLKGVKIALVESSEYSGLPDGDFKTALSTNAIPLIVRFKGGKSVKSEKGSMPLDVFKTSFTDL